VPSSIVECAITPCSCSSEASQRQQVAGVTGLHGAIAELDDSEALPGEQSGFFGVRDHVKLTLVVARCVKG